MIENPNPLSLIRQCELLGLNRAALYYRPTEVSADELELMALIDRQYLRTPFYGSRRMTAWLRTQGQMVNRKRVQRLMRLMGIEAIYQRQRTSRPAPEHRIYPYLLRGLVIERVNQVWAADICYIPMARGFLYLVAVMDWMSRYVLAWRLSNLLDSRFCVEALEDALSKGRPEIFNTDQGSQFTDDEFHGRAAGPWSSHQHGRTWALQRQHLRRTAVAQPQIRGGVPQGLPERGRGPAWHCRLLRFLQP
jgi:putative transposase